MKKVLHLILSSLLAAAVLCPSFMLPAAAKIPSPSNSFYVLDKANELSLSTEEHIVSVNEELERRTGAQVVVVCVRTTGNTEIADYAYQLFKKWEIGDEKKNNGVLILLAVQDSDYYALQGKGLENILSSGTLKLMLDDYLEPDFAVGDFDAGAKKMFDAVARFLSEVYSVTIGEYTTAPAVTETPTQTPTQEQQTTELFIVEDTTFDIEDWLLDFDNSFPYDTVFNGSFLSGLFSGISSGAFLPFRIIKFIISQITLKRIIILIVVILILRAIFKGSRHGGGGTSR